MGLAALDGLAERTLAERASVERALAGLTPAGSVERVPAGAVKSASLLAADALPVTGVLAGVFPAQGVRRGSVVEVRGSTTLVLLALAAVLPDHDWAAAVGLSSLNAAAAAEVGVDLARLALVPDPGAQWSRVVAALFDGFTVVLAGSPRQRPLARADANRLVARARERGSVLMVTDGWPLPSDHRLTVSSDEWQGLGAGQGRLRNRHLDVVASGRGGAARERRLSLLLSPEHRASVTAAAVPAFRTTPAVPVEGVGDLPSSVGW
jgi:hypothetical protein